MKNRLLIAALLLIGLPTLGRTSAGPLTDKGVVSQDNAEALADRVDKLEAQGKWREAIEPLQELVSLRPNDAARVNQLGRWRSWQTGWRDDALKLLKKACTISGDAPKYCTDYAEVLSWSDETRPEAVAELRRIVNQTPSYTPAEIRLATILSWNRNTLAEGRTMLASAVKNNPNDVSLLVAYADVLALSGVTRQQAMEEYDKALKIEPNNSHALTGKAQQLAWSGRSKEAMELYNRALAADPGNALALRGKAEILNWRGEYEQAAALLQRALEITPGDSSISAELVRSQLKLKRYKAAQETAAQLSADPDYRTVHEAVTRAAGSWSEVGVAFRRNRRNLDFNRLNVIVSSPMGVDNRLTVQYSPTLFSTQAGDFNSNSYGFAFDSRLSDKLHMNIAAGADTYPGMSAETTAGAQFRYRANSSWEFKFGGERTPVDESYLSLRGVNVAGVDFGQVSANLANVAVNYNNVRHGYDLSAGYSDGAFTGRGLDANRRWSVEANAGKSLGGAPYFRIGYGVTYTSFDYDASDPLAPATRFGDYFSPQKYLLNYGSLTVSHKAGEKFEFEATGTAGAQNAASATTNFGDVQFASSFSGKMLWRIRPTDEVRVQYEFLNVYNAFRRHVPMISYRHYF
jgi:tetratricopeptide (TPR) repeat protein